MRKYFLLILTFFIYTGAFAQQKTGDYPKADSVFIVNSVRFNITGFTRPYALINKGEFVTGLEIAGISGLEKYIREKTQLLMNERVLDSVIINYDLGELREDGKFPVDLVIDVKDTWNIVAIPRPKYSSNTGFDLTLKARDYNFLGTMSPLRLDMGFIHDEQGNNSYSFMLDSNIPFRFLKLNWNFNFDNFFDYRPDLDQPFYYKNITGLSAELPVGFTVFTFGFDESLVLNEENDDIYKSLYGEFQDGLYMSSKPYISWEIPTGFQAGKWGELTYTPRISAVFNHELQMPLDDHRKGPFLIIENYLGFNRVDWIGNFRKGGDVGVWNSYSHDFYKSGNGMQAWIIDLNFTGIGHFIITDFFGISARFNYRHKFFDDNGYAQAADVMRGILDKEVNAEYMLSLNLDFPVRLLKFKLSEWLNRPKLRIFNFELHLSPVIDAAFYRASVNSNSDNPNNFIVSGGAEIVVFPEFFRSLYLRVSMGWNFTDFSNGRNNELYIGTDFHF